MPSIRVLRSLLAVPLVAAGVAQVLAASPADGASSGPLLLAAAVIVLVAASGGLRGEADRPGR